MGRSGVVQDLSDWSRTSGVFAWDVSMGRSGVVPDLSDWSLTSGVFAWECMGCLHGQVRT